MSKKLLSMQDSLALDAEAAASWGLNPFALVEAAGRNCARLLAAAYPALFAASPRVTALAGGGNNGADALVMLRSLILSGKLAPRNALALLSKDAGEETTPRSQAILALKMMGVPVLLWDEVRENAEADIIIDGIAGTGLQGPLRGIPKAMTDWTNDRSSTVLAVSIDVPSGLFESWQEGMPIVRANAALAIEPLKESLYRPALRPYAGTIIPVGEVFPEALVESYHGAELITWETIQHEIPRIPPTAYKHERGVVEIHAGAPGFSGAARITARGAQAAGAGLIRLEVDPEIYPLLAVNAGGIMAAPRRADDSTGDPGRFIPDALILGPGWGTAPDRLRILEQAAAREAEGAALVLDADAIALAKGRRFHGRAILTPHPGEFAAYAGVPREQALENPGPLISALARERDAVIVFKGHVIYIACPQGRLGVVDGMVPVLAAGGSGDLLAGFCGALAARMIRLGIYDGCTCAAAAAALLIETGRSFSGKKRFCDPLELADTASEIAGEAWLS